jgi:hypothetical protein
VDHCVDIPRQHGRRTRARRSGRFALRYSFTTTISSVDTSALPAATNDQTLGGGSFIEPAAAVLYLNVRAEKTGAPSNLTFHHYARYRYVIP